MTKIVGNADCPECSTVSEVNQNKRGKLFLKCPQCGHFPYQTNRGQETLRLRMQKFQEANQKPEEPKPKQQPNNSGGFWITLIGDKA